MNTRINRVGFRPLLILVGWTSFGHQAGFGQTGQLDVSAQANVYGAGHVSAPSPGGGGGGIVPPLFHLIGGDFLTFQVTGQVSDNGGGNYYGADGYVASGTTMNPYGGLSGIQHTSRLFIAGVFLTDQEPVGASPPAIDISSGDFTELSPLLNQVFFIGDGLTGMGSGRIQKFYAPGGATRLALGFTDGSNVTGLPGDYADNVGSLRVTVEPRYSAQDWQSIGITNDLWDVRQGTTITTNSPLNNADGTPHAYDARDIFGGGFGDYLSERGSTIFIDYMTSGFTHYVEWRTPTPVTIRSFSMFAAGDDPRGEFNESREFATFRLKAKSPGSNKFDITLFTFSQTHPYTFSDQGRFLLISSDVRTTTAQEFRAEFMNRTGVTYDGPRIFELDGSGERIGTQASIRASEVEVCWNAGAGIFYQIEYRTNLPGIPWLPLGLPIAGTDSKMCITDKVPADAPRRFYRVRALD